MNRTRCWCGGDLVASVHPAYGKCVVCGTLATWNWPLDEELQARYSFDGYWHEHMKQPGQMPIEQRVENDLRDRIPRWWDILQRHMPQCESLLEIGCCHGMFLKYAREHGVKEVCGIEPDENTCVFARKASGANIYAGLFPSDEVCFRVRVNRNPFDAVAMFDVLEHVATPTAYTFDAILAERGALIIQTPDYDGQTADWPQFKPDEHLWLFTSASLRKLLAHWGFDNVSWERPVFAYDQIIIAKRG